MSRRKILTQSQRNSFESLPNAIEELSKHYIFSDDELFLINERRRDSNKIGFAVQICLLKYPGRLLRTDEIPPPEMLRFIGDQISVEPIHFEQYAKRYETLKEHRQILLQKINVTTFKSSDMKLLIRWLTIIAAENNKPFSLVNILVDEIKRRKILLPSIQTIENLVAIALHRAELMISRSVMDCISEKHIAAMNNLLSIGQSTYSWLRQPLGYSTPENILISIDRLNKINDLSLPQDVMQNISVNMRKHISREGLRLSIKQLREYSDSKRYTTILITLLELKKSITDDILTAHERYFGARYNRSKNKFDKNLKDKKRVIKQALDSFTAIGKVLLDSKSNGINPLLTLDKEINWLDFQSMLADVRELNEPEKQDHLHYLSNSYTQFRRYAPALLETFEFKTTPGGQSVMDAINLIRELNRKDKRKIPDDAPTEFIPQRWKQYILKEDGLDRH